MPVHAERRRIRPEPRPVEEKQFFDLETMLEQLKNQMQNRENESGLIIGIEKPGKISRWPKIKENVLPKTKGDFRAGKLEKNLRHILDTKWLLWHPLQLGDSIFLSKKNVANKYGAGWIKFKRDKKNYKRVKYLNEKYSPVVTKMSFEYETESKMAFEKLKNAVDSKTITLENRNRYLKRYKKEVQAAELKFMQTSTEVIIDFGLEMNGKKPKIYK